MVKSKIILGNPPKDFAERIVKHVHYFNPYKILRGLTNELAEVNDDIKKGGNSQMMRNLFNYRNGLKRQIEYYNNNFDKSRDIHMAKVYYKLKDGSEKVIYELHEDYEMPFYIDHFPLQPKFKYASKRSFKYYTQKQEYISLSKVRKHRSTRKELYKNIGRKLGKVNAKSKRDIVNSPYVYGTDITSEVYFKMEYDTCDIKQTFDVCYYDIEAHPYTDVINLISIVYKDDILTYVNRDYIKVSEEEYYKEVVSGLKKYIGEEEFNKYSFSIIIDNELGIITKSIAKVHELGPDILTGWSFINYDMRTINKRLYAYGVNPEDVWSDPDVPRELRHMTLAMGDKSVLTAGNVYKTKSYEERWDVVYTPAKFRIFDAMQVFEKIRVTAAKEPAYSIQFIGSKYGGKILKMKTSTYFPNLYGAELHIAMAEQKFIPYTVYNIIDVLTHKALEENIKDLTVSFPIFSGYAPLDVFKSGPQKLNVAYAAFLFDKGFVIGNNETKEETDRFKPFFDRRKSVVTLHIKRNTNNPSASLFNYNIIGNRLVTVAVDLDQSAGYPNNTIAANMSRTSMLEFLTNITYQGEPISKDLARENFLSLAYGNNILGFSRDMFGLDIDNIINQLKNAILEEIKDEDIVN